MKLTNSSKELSDIRVEFTMGNADFFRIRLTGIVYMKADKSIQNRFSVTTHFLILTDEWSRASLTDYRKGFSVQKRKGKVLLKPKKRNPWRKYFFNEIELYDLSMKPVSLPDKGLIFIDLWYVGCSPCMRSAR